MITHLCFAGNNVVVSMAKANFRKVLFAESIE